MQSIAFTVIIIAAQ